MDLKFPPCYEETAAVNVSPSASSINVYDKSGEANVSPFAPSINVNDKSEEGTSKAPSAPPLDSSTYSLPNFDVLNEEDLRDACYSYATDNCCYGSKFVSQMTMLSIRDGCTYHYKLESFGEKRESAHRSTPYYGQAIDGPENGPPPAPWEVIVPDTVRFVDNRTTKEIPHTAYVKQCGTCVGNGKVRCSWCSGSGSTSCSSCGGSGRNSDDDRCTSCSGSGSSSCSSCSGSGMVTCSTCNGHGKLKHYELLIVTWKNHEEDFISNTMNLPRDLIKDATGKQIYSEIKKGVEPLNHCPESTINQASLQLIRKHNSSFLNELIIMQRQSIRAVPITKAVYRWREEEGEFFVYGTQRKVYFKDYPQPCCCCPLC